MEEDTTRVLKEAEGFDALGYVSLSFLIDKTGLPIKVITRILRSNGYIKIDKDRWKKNMGS